MAHYEDKIIFKNGRWKGKKWNKEEAKKSEKRGLVLTLQFWLGGLWLSALMSELQDNNSDVGIKREGLAQAALCIDSDKPWLLSVTFINTRNETYN